MESPGAGAGRLPADVFESIVRLTPLISIDLIVRSPDDSILLGLRRNEPARGTWFVPGGRVRKDERFNEAFARIARDELSVELAARDARFLGVFEHIYDENFAERAGWGTHYLVLGFEVRLAELPEGILQDQHDEFRWFSLDELQNSPHVHKFTKAYFLNRSGIKVVNVDGPA
jgi:colanic acid biosynthesis protein WcaH